MGGVQADSVVLESRGGVIAAPSLGSSNSGIAPGSSQVTSNGGKKYTVEAGESLYGIARAHGISVDSLCSANGITNSEHIRTGQQLHIPSGAVKKSVASSAVAKATAKPKSYIVQPGDTIGAIALRHHVSTDDLLAANNLDYQQAKRIRQGQMLKLL